MGWGGWEWSNELVVGVVWKEAPKLTTQSVGVGVGVRVTRKFQVEQFGYLKFRVLRIDTQNYNGFYNTRKFGYPKFRVRVFPNYPNYCVGFIKIHTPY